MTQSVKMVVTGPYSSGKTQFTLQSYPGDTDAVGQLVVGRADAVLTQDTSGAYQKKQNPGKLAIAYLFPEKIGRAHV